MGRNERVAIKPRLRDENGASAVEFALIAALLFMILFGTIQFGIAYNRYQGQTSAAREGARLASVGASYGDIAQRVKDTLSLIATDSSHWQDQCSPNPPTTNEMACLIVSYVNTSNALVTIPSSTTSPPCDTAQANNSAAAEVSVQVKYKMAITIPFVFNTITPVITTEGRFRCET